jgi:predicted nucleic acid-binding protein
MNRIYLDTSAYVKVYKRERGSRHAKEIIDLAKQDKKIRIYMSFWVINESISVVDQAYKKKHQISEKQYETLKATILARIIEYSGSNIIFVPLRHKDVEDSIKYIYDYAISADDALHVHVAHKFRCNYLLTNDGHLRQQTDRKINNLRVLNITNNREMDQLISRMSTTDNIRGDIPRRTYIRRAVERYLEKEP